MRVILPFTKCKYTSPSGNKIVQNCPIYYRTHVKKNLLSVNAHIFLIGHQGQWEDSSFTSLPK